MRVHRLLHGVGLAIDPISHHGQVAAEFFDQCDELGHLVLGEQIHLQVEV